MRPSVCISTLAAAAVGVHAAGVSSNPPISNVFTYPMNRFIENIAVRANSKLLVTSMSVPDLFSIDPTATTPVADVVHTFANATGLMGITEVTPDVFALVSGEWDLPATRALPGTMVVWTVDFKRLNGSRPCVDKVTGIVNSTIFNGLARHPYNPRLLMAADSALGAVWRVDLLTGAYDVAFSSPLLTPTGTVPGTNLGINGLRSSGSHLYFTNSARKFYGRVAIDITGNMVGAIEILANSTAAGANVVYDDIALDSTGGAGGGGAWIASHPSYAIHVAANGSQVVVNDTQKLLNPTSAAFGRGSSQQRKTLYITNGGEFVGFDLVNSGIVAIDLS